MILKLSLLTLILSALAACKTIEPETSGVDQVSPARECSWRFNESPSKPLLPYFDNDYPVYISISRRGLTVRVVGTLRQTDLNNRFGGKLSNLTKTYPHVIPVNYTAIHRPDPENGSKKYNKREPRGAILETQLVKLPKNSVMIVYPAAMADIASGYNSLAGRHGPGFIRMVASKRNVNRGENDDYFGGFPYLEYTPQNHALHGPITANEDGTAWKLSRGRMSHGCQRMEGEHIMELSHLLRCFHNGKYPGLGESCYKHGTSKHLKSGKKWYWETVELKKCDGPKKKGFRKKRQTTYRWIEETPEDRSGVPGFNFWGDDKEKPKVQKAKKKPKMIKVPDGEMVWCEQLKADTITTAVKNSERIASFVLVDVFEDFDFIPDPYLSEKQMNRALKNYQLELRWTSYTSYIPTQGDRGIAGVGAVFEKNRMAKISNLNFINRYFKGVNVDYPRDDSYTWQDVSTEEAVTEIDIAELKDGSPTRFHLTRLDSENFKWLRSVEGINQFAGVGVVDVITFPTWDNQYEDRVSMNKRQASCRRDLSFKGRVSELKIQVAFENKMTVAKETENPRLQLVGCRYSGDVRITLDFDEASQTFTFPSGKSFSSEVCRGVDLETDVGKYFAILDQDTEFLDSSKLNNLVFRKGFEFRDIEVSTSSCAIVINDAEEVVELINKLCSTKGLPRNCVDQRNKLKGVFSALQDSCDLTEDSPYFVDQLKKINKMAGSTVLRPAF